MSGGLDRDRMANLLERIAIDIRGGAIDAVYVAINSSDLGCISASTGFEPGAYRELMDLVATEAPGLAHAPGPKLQLVEGD